MKLDLGNLLAEQSADEIQKSLDREGFLLLRNVYQRERIEFIKAYLTRVMSGSLPNYQPLTENCDNFFRINFDDTRSTVLTKSVQFNFFPWNQDFCGFFEKFESLFAIRNDVNAILSREISDRSEANLSGLVKRLSVQFYPAGGGYLQSHSDPVGAHQLAIANVVMSEQGRDFAEGGLFIKRSLGSEKLYPEAEACVGDVVVFKANMIHGVDPIDPHESFEPLNGRGRWMLLSAVTKASGSTIIEDSRTFGD